MRLPKSLEDKIFYYSISGVEKFSTEAYWQKGKTPLSLALTEYIQELRTFWDGYLAITNPTNIKTVVSKKLEILKALTNKHEKKLAEVMNAESVSIGYDYDANAGCYGLAIDKNLIAQKKEKNRTLYGIDISFEKKIGDIVETNNGYRFRNKKDIKLLFIFGFGFFKQGLTDDEMVAVMLHEFGHALQNMLVAASTEIAVKEKRWVLRSLISSFGATFRKIKNVSSWDETWASQQELKAYSEYDRDETAKELEAATKENIELMIKYKRKFLYKGEIPFFLKVICSITLQWIQVVAQLVYLPIWWLLDKAKYAFGLNKRFLSQNIRFEQFADYTAAQFGYGPEFTSGLNKSHYYEQKYKQEACFTNNDVAIDFGFWNLIYYVPIVNVLLAYQGYQMIKQRCYLAGYPTTPERFAGIYKALEYELNNNKKLTAEDKEAIKRDMEETKKAWEMSIDRKSPKFFVFNVFCKLTHRTIDSKAASANIEENVLKAFNEAEREYIRDNNLKIDEGDL